MPSIDPLQPWPVRAVGASNGNRADAVRRLRAAQRFAVCARDMRDLPMDTRLQFLSLARQLIAEAGCNPGPALRPLRPSQP